MVKAFDSIIADYAGNKVKVNGEEYKVGACCVDLLNCLNGTEEKKEIQALSERILGVSPLFYSDVLPQEHLDSLGEDIVSLLRQVKTVRPFTACAKGSKAAGVRQGYTPGVVRRGFR